MAEDFSVFKTPGQTVRMYNKKTGQPYMGTAAALASGEWTLTPPYPTPSSPTSSAANTIKTTTSLGQTAKNTKSISPVQPSYQLQYQFPYEQLLRDTLSKIPKYEMPSESELLSQARTYASLQVDPQVSALNKALEQTRQSARTQEEKTKAAYAGLPETASRLLKEAGTQATESAIARGGGRSGAVEWLTSKLQTPITESMTKAEAEKAAALNAIAEQLALAEQQGSSQLQELERQRGALEAAQLAALRQQAEAQATGNWQLAAQAAQNLAEIAVQADQFNKSLGANLLPYTDLTESQRQGQVLDWAQVMGEVPDTATITSRVSPTVQLRSYAASLGKEGSIGYDPATKSVIIGSKKYTPSDLEGLGGVLTNGRWYLPQSVIDRIL